MLDPDQRAFLALALTVARQTDPSVTADPSTFELRFAHGTFRLPRLYAALSDAPRDVREREMHRQFRELEATSRPPDSREELLETVVPRVSCAGQLLAHAIRGGWDPTGPFDDTSPFADLGAGIGIDVIARKGPALHPISPRLLAAHGLSFPEVFEAAMLGHETRRRPECGDHSGAGIASWPLEPGSATLWFDIDSGNQGSALTLPLLGAEVLQDWVWLLGSQERVLGAPPEDRAALEGLFDVAQASFDDPYRVCPVPLTTTPTDHGGVFTRRLLEWVPESEDDPLYDRVVALNRRHRLQRWEGIVRPALREAEQALRGPHARTVARMDTMADPARPDTVATWTSWSSEGGLIPTNTTYVGVQHPGAAKVGFVHRYRIDEVLRAARVASGWFALYDLVPGGLPEAHRGVLDAAVLTVEADASDFDRLRAAIRRSGV